MDRRGEADERGGERIGGEVSGSGGGGKRILRERSR